MPVKCPTSYPKLNISKIGLSFILLNVVYGEVNTGELYGDLPEPSSGVLIPFPALNPGSTALTFLILPRFDGSPSSSVQGDAILESSIWKFAYEAEECESLFAEIEALHGRCRRTRLLCSDAV
jgi:hypothetical protein